MKDDSIYNGEMKIPETQREDGSFNVQHGQGILILPDGTVKQGHWVDGRMEG